MNAYELPFKDNCSPTVIAALHVPTNTVCFNANMVLDLFDASKAERLCEGILSHETVHGVLLEDEGYDVSVGYDYFDGWENEYLYSIIPQSSASKVIE